MKTTTRSATQAVVISRDQPRVIIGERINPRGRRKLAAALEQGNLKLAQEEASKPVREGAHALDINVAAPGP
jgi:5-methyltetrahydrofolate--homocysteine methyltransferase